MKTQWILGGLGVVAGLTVGMESAIAQVTADGTLSTNVTSPDNLNFTIEDGARSGDNLYHSFSQFSVPTGGSAVFNNALDIQNIFARVTGGTASNLDGLIQANGIANLFLLNPAGMLFSANARLNIGGSFIGTTADSIHFADGVVFSAIDPTASTLLTISTPIGLQMGQNPSPITLQGTGHTLISTGPFFLPPHPSASNLQVQPGKTLALVGGNFSLNGANLVAAQGRIELGSLSGAGLVYLTPMDQGYALAYESGQDFGDIHLAQRSRLDVGGVNSGSVQLQGRQIKMTDGSLILSQNLGPLTGGNIHLQASERLDLIGTTLDSTTSSGVVSESIGTGAGGSLRIITPQLTLQSGARLFTSTYGSANSGDIDVMAAEIALLGFSPTNPSLVTSLTTSTYGVGNAGNLLVNSHNLLLSDGAALASATFGTGSSGQVNTNTTTATVIGGTNPLGIYSNISSTTFSLGNAKNLTLNAARLRILDGGVVAATAFFIGTGGDVNVEATELIEISGRSATNVSSINSSTVYPPPSLQQAFGLPNILTANAGSVRVTTPYLVLTEGGSVSVTNQGTGNGGTLTINTNILNLDDQGSVTASTQSGEGGNLNLQIRDLLLMRHNSLISATAGGIGNGGDIFLNAPVIVGLENSDIIANAFAGNGGNIAITTQGIFGPAFRDQLTSESDITASSQLGVSGTVEINNFSLDPNSGLVELPNGLADSSNQVAQGCAANGGNEFVATGRGGIPASPTEILSRDRTWTDTRDLSTFLQGTPSPLPPSPHPTELTEATTWHTTPTGQVELVAINSVPSNPQPYATCSVPTLVSHL